MFSSKQSSESKLNSNSSLSAIFACINGGYAHHTWIRGVIGVSPPVFYCALVSSRESGWKGWIPHECIDWKRLFSDEACDQDGDDVQLKWKEKSDIQAAGMVAFYIYTKGKHPFGPPIDQLKNLQNDNPVGLENVTDPVLKDLLSQMLSQDL